MPQNPPEGNSRVSPMVFYDDLASAIEFIEKAFGLATKLTLPGPDGGLLHAERTCYDAVIMFGPADGERGQQSPQRLGAVNQSIYCYVDKIDEHFKRAVASGATVVSEPQDMFWGDRMYDVRDCEGHLWSFAERTRDPDPSAMPG